MPNFGKERSLLNLMNGSKKHISFIAKAMNIIVLIKIFTTIFCFKKGCVSASPFIIFTVPLVLALSFDIELNTIGMIIILLVLFCESVFWLILLILCFIKSKNSLKGVLFIVVSALDIIACFISIISSFSIAKILTIIFNIVYLILGIVMFSYKTKKVVVEDDNVSVGND